MEFNSIAMIETNGLVSAITALDVMLKLGEIRYLKREVISNGYVTIFVEGNVTELKRILQAGSIAANNVGSVISSSIIENPDKLLYELILDKKSKHGTQLPKVKSKTKKLESEKILTLFDNEEKLNSSKLSTSSDAPQILVEESEKSFRNDIFIDESQDDVYESKTIKYEKIEVTELDKIETPESEILESTIEEIPDKEVIEIGREETPESEILESTIEEISDKEVIEMEREETQELEVLESTIEEITNEEVKEMESEETPELEILESKTTEYEKIEVTELDKIETLESEILESKKEEISDKEVIETERKVVPEAKILESDQKEISEPVKVDSHENEVNTTINLSHLERLRLEAKLEIERENKGDNYQNIIPKKEISYKKFSEMNVHELRKLARSNANFPIKGREISKANRSILINYFNDIS